MASNHTANLALNQWEANDPVLRTDFNADNQKIDAALKSLFDSSPVELLGRFRFTQGAQRLDIDLTGFDLSKYVKLELKLTGLTLQRESNLLCLLNGLTGCYNNSRNSSSPLYSVGTMYAKKSLNDVPVVFGGVSIVLNGHALAGKCYYSQQGQTYAYCDEDKWGVHPSYVRKETLTAINVVSNAPVTGGTLTLVGWRF